VADGDVALPDGHAGCHVLVVTLGLVGVLAFLASIGVGCGEKTHVLVRNIAAAAHDEQHRLLPRARGGVVGQQARADDTDGVDAAVPNVVHGLGSTAGEAGSHDLARVDVGVVALAGVGSHPVDGGLHGLRVGAATALGPAFGDGQEAVAGDLLQEGLVGQALVAAGAVAPDEDRHFGGAGRLGRVVDGVVTEGGLGLVGCGGVGAGAAAALVDC
jgi:hypothetical protein